MSFAPPKPVPRLLRSIGFRLAAWYSALLVAGILAALASTYGLLKSSLKAHDREALQAMVDRIESAYREEGERELRGIAARQRLLPRGFSLIRFAPPRRLPQTLLAPELAPAEAALPALSDAGGKPGWAVVPVLDGEAPMEVLTARLPDGAWLQVGKSVEPRDEVLERARHEALLIVLPLVALGLAGGLFMTGRLLSPVRGLIAAVKDIDSGRSETRVAASGAGDELDELGRLFNGMLDRIFRLVQAMRGSLDAVAHDLRTPMTRLRAQAELALGARNDPAALREALEGCVEQADEVLQLLDRLMEVSEAEAGAMRLSRAPLDLGEAARDAAGLYEDAAEQAGLTLTVEAQPGLIVDGDRLRLRQAAANLLDNAVKFTPSGGTVALRCFRDGAQAVLEVADTGPGIPDGDLPRVWDRLFRGDQARSKRGLGLGLSLVSAVAAAHGGRASAANAPGGGAVLQLRLPLR